MGNSVLDIGCGYGNTLLGMLPTSKGQRVIFNDLSSEHLEIIVRRLEKRKYAHNNNYNGDFYLNNKLFPDEMDFPDNSFSSILFSYVAHYLTPTEIEVGMQKMYDWLIPGGRVYYRVLSINAHPFYFYRNEYERRKTEGDRWPGYIESLQNIDLPGKPTTGFPDSIHPHGVDELTRLAEETGFTLNIISKSTTYKELHRLVLLWLFSRNRHRLSHMVLSLLSWLIELLRKSFRGLCNMRFIITHNLMM